MQQVVFHRFPDVNVEFAFKLRNHKRGILVPHIPEIRKEIDHLCTLRFASEELDYLRMLPFLSENYIEFLRLFQFNPNYIDVYERNGVMNIKIEGSWLNTILFEVPVLAIVSEVFSKRVLDVQPINGQERLINKTRIIEGTSVKFADFGTRRRFSSGWQYHVLQHFNKEIPENFIGTSNVKMAMELGIKAIGTMAHEYIQAMQALVRLMDSQKFALENWVQEYRGDLGIALSDTLGMDAFLNDFDLFYAKLFDGVRHDSGDPYGWCEKLLGHYHKLGIDAKTKTAVFSDGLTFEKVREIHNAYRGLIKLSFGIGTYLTNDMGKTAPQIVIKMVRCNDQPVAKISDSPGKQMCNDVEYLRYLKSVFNIQRELEVLE